MTLRLRLVLALVLLLTVGLAVFGFVTYGLYARSQYDQLDEQIASSLPEVRAVLFEALADRTGHGGPPGPISVYAQLRDADGEPLATSTSSSTTADVPELPDELEVEEGSARFLTVGSVDGDTEWRVLAQRSRDDLSGVDLTTVVAFPTTEIKDSLRRLLFFETVTAAGLLTLLAMGSWLILRHGLRPLERIASTASTLTAGELDTRVEPADEHSEVGQLGLALNTMLSKLEDAFHERDATERRLRQFLADASHELRTPLTSIQGFAELFRLGADQDEADMAVTMRRIEQETGRMHILIDDLLLLARLDQTRPIERVLVDLAVLAADACSDAVAADPARQVTLDAPEPVVVSGDSDHLRQAIANLVTNARRHTPPGTPIEVTARIDGGRAVVTVRDHGEGLDDEGVLHAFDRFWQANPSRSASGAGLGLSIVDAIADEHGGTATVANAEDGGALFTLDLPISAS